MGLLAVMGIVVGVANDAVNFLNSALGSKAAPRRVILWIAAAGILVGTLTSSGMMEVARSGVFYPGQFSFPEIMMLFLGMMLGNILLLDIYNTLGLPTSTTVSMVFELLGASFAFVMIKMAGDGLALGMGDYLNTSKALEVIFGIFMSVPLAFIFGSLIQYLTRLIFTFEIFKNLRFKIGIFGGVAITSILYFMLFKGLKQLSFMSADVKAYLDENILMVLGLTFVVSTILMQLLHMLKVNVFRVIVLCGTFALATAFAGNDLVNFIGVPLAGYSSFLDFTANGSAFTPDTFMMHSLHDSATTPIYFLAAAGAIMVFSLATSKKARKVVETEVGLSRKSEGDEMFGSSKVARSLVRWSNSVARSVSLYTPESVSRFVDKRFQTPVDAVDNGAAYDMLRASVNLVVASLLIALGTSLKLPLSTTFVTFMVAMGTSLADRAWGRDSAVFRITGVLSVIGGWFITAGAAFTICFFVALIIHFGGTVAILALIGLAVFMLIRSQVMYKKRKEKEKGNETLKQLMKSTDNNEVIELLRKHTREELVKIMEFTEENFERTVTSFLHENLRGLRRAMGSVKFEKQLIKQMKRTGTLAMCRLDNNTVLEKGLYYYQGNDFASELVYSVGRLCEPCLEHIDNNFNPLDAIQKGEFTDVAEDICYLLQVCRHKLETNNYDELETEIRKANDLNGQLSHLKREELQRIQSQSGSIKVSMVYLTMIQEAQNVVTYTINLMKVSRKFQVEKEEL